ncbi:MAG: hypothetical protein ACETV1_04380 [Candidatus Bathyarchaeia archaeon]
MTSRIGPRKPLLVPTENPDLLKRRERNVVIQVKGKRNRLETKGLKAYQQI